MTDQAIIAASYSAEKSYTHNLDNVIDASDAVGAWGTAKESTTELSDLSGTGNVADIHGAMPTEGFIQGRRFDGVDDHLLIPAATSHDVLGNSTIEIIVFNGGSTASIPTLLNKSVQDDVNGFWWIYTSGTNEVDIVWQYADGISPNLVTFSDVFTYNTINHLLFKYDNTAKTIELLVDGASKGIKSTPNSIPPKTNTAIFINTYQTSSNAQKGIIYATMVYDEMVNGNFNTFARLPFWSINYTDYPDNVTTYTDYLPYSSSVISSGTFKVDDDKLQCVSAGTMTYSASYDFDGSEYIKVDIDGVEYAGTGTITQGNTTVSVAQGSNKVTIVMGTGDKIEGEIKIQFRDTV